LYNFYSVGNIKSRALIAVILYFSVLLAACGAALTLRVYSLNNIQITSFKDISVVSVLPAEEKESDMIVKAVLDKESIRKKALDSKVELAYLMPSDFFNGIDNRYGKAFS